MGRALMTPTTSASPRPQALLVHRLADGSQVFFNDRDLAQIFIDKLLHSSTLCSPSTSCLHNIDKELQDHTSKMPDTAKELQDRDAKPNELQDHNALKHQLEVR